MRLGLGLGINFVKGIFRFFSHYWVDHSGNNLTDHNGNKIIFRKRK